MAAFTFGRLFFFFTLPSTHSVRYSFVRFESDGVKDIYKAPQIQAAWFIWAEGRYLEAVWVMSPKTNSMCVLVRLPKKKKKRMYEDSLYTRDGYLSQSAKDILSILSSLFRFSFFTRRRMYRINSIPNGMNRFNFNRTKSIYWTFTTLFFSFWMWHCLKR